MPSPKTSYQARAISIPSSRNSPASSPYQYQFGSNGSLQSTPEGMVPVSHSSLPIPPSLHLPDAILLLPPTSTPPTSSPSAMSEALSKGPGLIRRVSRGARDIPNKFRRAGSHAHRDKSSGPVIMRRRSDSRTAADNAVDGVDLDSPYDEEEAVEDFIEPFNALGISADLPGVSSIPDSTVIAPTRYAILEAGTVLRKVTKKEVKTVTLRLDLEHAKVSWDLQRPSKSFYIDDVKEIRSGLEAKHYREQCEHVEDPASLWFTIIYSDTSRSKGKLKSMHLIAHRPEIVKLWTSTLDSVSRNRIDMMSGLFGAAEKSAKLVWQREMQKRFNGAEHAEEDETMDLSGIITLCRSLHINCSESTFRDYFQDADDNRTGKLNKVQFLYFVRQLKERKDIRAIYSRIAPKDSGICKEDFFSFLRTDQAVDVDNNIDHWTAVFDKAARSSKPKTTTPESSGDSIPPTIGFNQFQSFMTSPANSCFVPKNAQLLHNRPLNEYFISSSHNTYLLGRQVVGESSTEAYITALQKGCRCIEVDCWNGRDGQPIVSHGRTFTTSISFRDTISVINQYAFCESKYPLIISLEVHCNPEQQALMAMIMAEEFREKLVLQPLDLESTTLPSPEELKNRILIKVKAAAPEIDTRALTAELSGRKRDRSFSSPFFRPQLTNDTGIPNAPLVSSPHSMSPPERTAAFWTSPRTSTTSTNTTMPTSAFMSSADDSDSPPTTEVEDKKKSKTRTSKIVKVLGDLGVYTKGVKFTSFRSADASSYNHVYSLGEHTFNKLGKAELRDIDEHNRNYLMRVYPGYNRITSTNFEPLGVWRRGVQMAALNWQTYDLGQQLNEAMFSAGDDRTGYVLKPAELRLGEDKPASGRRQRPPKKQVKFAVEIISAQQLPRPKGLAPDADVNPCVEFEMHCAEDMGPNAIGEGGQDTSTRNGLSGLGEPVRKRTRIVRSNGYNPEFNDRITMTLTTRYPSLVFVRWSVWNSRDAQNPERAPLATFTAKLSSLQQGYRHLPLFDSNGEQYLFSTLFCKIEKMDAMDAPAEMIPERAGSRRSSVESTIIPPETASQRTGRSFLTRLVSRKNSGRKRSKEMDDRTSIESKESKLDLISRSSTIERDRA
ncbi:1-phosphatidylinositol-4,5-bisphosphate phosphodiesterase 1 [Dendryphion nanum]|uniref:Phosphoinositide phospholipase C n=1 Tax=Dendryphion nanum TaxID=256645 RepID=A0A9P9E715_9PLEO|nr:1-phosphatidylinositol-4,5-bisphosphate phosphodiesterase 1 [Dendryphion nanum]